MRNVIILAVLVSAGAQTVSATDITLRPYLGYGFGAARQGAGSDVITNTSNIDTKDAVLLYSAGAGLKIGLGADVGLNENFSIEPVLGYSNGTEKLVNRWNDQFAGGGGPNAGSKKESTSFVPFSVTLKIRAKHGAFTPYAGFGPTLAFGAEGTTLLEETWGGVLYKTEVETTYKTGFGFHGVVGTDYKVSDRFVIFGQLRADQLSLKPSKGKMTKYTENGVNLLSAQDVRDREIIYKDDIGGAAIGPTVPDVQQANPIAASSLAFTFGVAYKF